MDRVDVVYALICNEATEEVLMVKNRHSTWSLPGGAVEKGETLEQAVIRETKEETNLLIEAGNITAVNEAFFVKHRNHGLLFTFNAKLIGGEIAIKDKDEIEEIKWMDLKTANELMPYHPRGVKGLLESSVPYIFQGEC